MAADVAPQMLGGLLNDAVESVGRDRKADLAEMLKASKADSEARRKRVLKHQDLRERLQALGFTNPEHWKGWIPPKTAQEDACPACRDSVVKRPPCGALEHRARHNDSLLGIFSAAQQGVHGGGHLRAPHPRSCCHRR